MKKLALLTLAVCLLSSCELFREKSYDPENYVRNPWKDLETVVVLPWLNESTQQRIDMDALGNTCASELVKFPGFRVFRPYHVRKIIGEGTVITTIEEALVVGRQLKADAILAVSVTEYDPYYPPRIAVTVQLLRVTARQMSAAEIDRITTSASWRTGPYDLSRQYAGNFMSAFDAVYDSSGVRAQDEIKAYVDAQNKEFHAWSDIQEYLMVSHRYIQFVSAQIFNRIIREAGNRT